MKQNICLKIALITAVAVATLLTACDRRTVYDHYQSTPTAGWEKNDTLLFDIPPLSDAGNYYASLGLRTTDSYPFTAVTLIVEQHLLPSQRIVVDTVDCKLTDEQGKPLGSGIGYRQYQFAIGRLSLAASDSLHILVRHDMKREILPGIADVGITLKKE